MKLEEAKSYCSKQKSNLSDYSEKLFELYSSYVFTKKCKVQKYLMFAIPNSTKCYFVGHFKIFENTTAVKKFCYQEDHFFLCESNSSPQLHIKPATPNSEYQNQLTKKENSWTIVIILSVVIILIVAYVSYCCNLSYRLS